MKRALSVTAIFAIALWGATVIAPRLHAQGNSEVTQAASSDATLDEPAMKTLLLNMGYEPKKLSEGYEITIARESWTYHVQLLLSPNHEKIGLNAIFGAVKNPDAIPASAWRSMLEKNRECAPSYFFLDKDAHNLWLNRAIDNRGVTAAVLRKQIDNFCADQRSAYDVAKAVL